MGEARDLLGEASASGPPRKAARRRAGGDSKTLSGPTVLIAPGSPAPLSPSPRALSGLTWERSPRPGREGLGDAAEMAAALARRHEDGAQDPVRPDLARGAHEEAGFPRQYHELLGVRENMIVCNLVRLLMLKAGVTCGVNHRRLSFRGGQQVLLSCRKASDGLGARPILRKAGIQEMWRRIAERFVVGRPKRNEPRRVNRWPKCTRWLQKPRHEYSEHFRSDDPPLRILDQAA